MRRCLPPGSCRPSESPAHKSRPRWTRKKVPAEPNVESFAPLVLKREIGLRDEGRVRAGWPAVPAETMSPLSNRLRLSKVYVKSFGRLFSDGPRLSPLTCKDSTEHLRVVHAGDANRKLQLWYLAGSQEPWTQQCDQGLVRINSLKRINIRWGWVDDYEFCFHFRRLSKLNFELLYAWRNSPPEGFQAIQSRTPKRNPCEIRIQPNVSLTLKTTRPFQILVPAPKETVRNCAVPFNAT